MSTGRLAAVHVSNENVVTKVYTPPLGKQAVCTLSVCNLNTTSVMIKIALLADEDQGTNVLDGEWIEFSFELTPNNTYERTGLILLHPQTISVASTDPVAAVVWGYED
jgi:hypothetical protein